MKMKYLFIYPPAIMNFAPIIGIPNLIGILESEGVESKMYDLNANFLTNHFSKSFFEKFKDNYEHIYSDDFLKNIPQNRLSNVMNMKLPEAKLCKYIEYYSNKLDFCNYILRNDFFFYNPILCHFAINVISDAINLILQLEKQLIEGLLPGVSEYFSSDNTKHHLNIDFIKYYINSDANIFKEYLAVKAKEIIKEKPDCIGVSINTNSQFFPALTLIHLIKQNSPGIHIDIGGAFFGTLYKNISNLNEFMNEFCDTISIGNGDSTVCELIKSINKQKKIENIPNILYCRNNQIYETIRDNGRKLSEYPMSSFNGYKKSDYITPELVLPVRTSVSCYWGKCTFCNCKRDRLYQTQNVETFVSELEHLSKKYSTKYFYLWDNAIHPNYAEKLADLIIKKKLKIKYSIYARFEKEFDRKLLKKLKKSGCLRINWGLDSASENILKFINKGINLDNAKRILKESHKLGITNFVSLILGYPTETLSEMEKDVEFFKENKENIDIVAISNSVYFLEGSELTKHKEEMQKQILTTIEERTKYAEEIHGIFNSSAKYWHYVATYNLLYIDKYSYNFLGLIRKILDKLTHYKLFTNLTVNFYEFIYKIKIKQ